MPALLRSVDLFALASKFEPFGVALLEAKAAGLPIVATAVNEIPEISPTARAGCSASGERLEHGGLFVKLAQDRDLRGRLGARARIEAQQHSLQAAVAAYESLYDASLEQRSQVWSPAGAPTRRGSA